MQKETTACFTGHRPERICFPFWESSQEVEHVKLFLHNAILSAVNDGYTDFLCGMARGVDIWAGELIISLKRQFPNLALHAVIPYEGQQQSWPVGWQTRYQNLLHFSCQTIILSPQYTKGCFFERNRFMVDRSSRLIGVFDGIKKGGTAFTIDYARKNGVRCDLILIEGVGSR